MVVSAKFIVDSASEIAEFSGIRQSVISATIIAAGTSLPELAADVAAVRRKHLDLALGDIIGSCITNVTLVLGLVLVMSDAAVNFGALYPLVAFAIISPFVLYLFIRKTTIKKSYSMALFAIYVVFVVTMYQVSPHLGEIGFD